MSDSLLLDVEEGQPLTEAQLAALRHFLRVHHPPLCDELERCIKGHLLHQLPILFSLLYRDMRRFQAGEPTRHVQFLSFCDT